MRAGLLAATTMLAGCFGMGRDDAPALDRSTTGSVPQRVQPFDEPASDETAVMDAVARIDLGRRPHGPYAWANPATGSTGVIAAIEEGDGACRRFKTTLHRYDGIALFDGVGCKGGDGTWNLTAFQPVGGGSSR